MANQILFHDELVRNVRKNIKFFGNPTLISSRPKHDITESGDEQTFRPTISSQAGFYAQNPPEHPGLRTLWRRLTAGWSDQGAAGDCQP